MKYQTVIFALFGLTFEAQGAQVQDEWDQEYDNYAGNENEDIWAGYDTEAERNAWFYGNPGDPNYVDPTSISEEDLKKLEEEWEIDLWIQ